MSETMSNVERGLWRIAELGARCSQQSANGSRGPLWAELEETIARLDAEFEATRQAVDIAPAQVRSLEGRLNVAKKERDREKARAEEYLADAEAARRERDRMAAKAAKTVAALAETRAAAVQAEKAAAEAGAKATAAQAALDQAQKARNELVATLDETLAARDRALNGLDIAEECIATLEARLRSMETDVETARAERDAVRTDREAVRAERDALRAERDELRAERDELRTAQDAARTGRADALEELAARAEGAVVVLPGVALPEAEAGPVAPAARVSWRPTWSEWARDDEADETVVDVADPAVTVVGTAAPAEVDLDVDDTSLFAAAGAETTVRYLNVAATIGQLLPEDLGPLLLSGATIVRREGRLFATVAVTSDPWAAPGSTGDQQAQKLAEAGLKVEWTSDAPLAC